MPRQGSAERALQPRCDETLYHHTDTMHSNASLYTYQHLQRR